MKVRYELRLVGGSALVPALQPDDDAFSTTTKEDEDLVIRGDGKPTTVRRALDDLLVTIGAAQETTRATRESEA